MKGRVHRHAPKTLRAAGGADGTLTGIRKSTDLPYRSQDGLWDPLAMLRMALSLQQAALRLTGGARRESGAGASGQTACLSGRVDPLTIAFGDGPLPLTGGVRPAKPASAPPAAASLRPTLHKELR